VDETYIGHNGTTKDTAPKPLIVSVEEGVPKVLFLASQAGVERFGHKWFLICRSKDVITSDLPTGRVGKSYFVMRAGKARPEL
jgi:hypothetical protein